MGPYLHCVSQHFFFQITNVFPSGHVFFIQLPFASHSSYTWLELKKWDLLYILPALWSYLSNKFLPPSCFVAQKSLRTFAKDCILLTVCGSGRWNLSQVFYCPRSFSCPGCFAYVFQHPPTDRDNDDILGEHSNKVYDYLLLEKSIKNWQLTVKNFIFIKFYSILTYSITVCIVWKKIINKLTIFMHRWARWNNREQETIKCRYHLLRTDERIYQWHAALQTFYWFTNNRGCATARLIRSPCPCLSVCENDNF